MAAEVIAGLGLFKIMFDTAKGLKDINDAAIRNGAVVELQEKILAAQAQQAALVDRIRELEKEVADFEAWDREKQRYQLTDHGRGTFTRALKPGMEAGEPFHRICAHCFEQRRKSILQHSHRVAGQEHVGCPSCKLTFRLGTRQQRIPKVVDGVDFDVF
jgi:hypothetical protein